MNRLSVYWLSAAEFRLLLAVAVYSLIKHIVYSARRLEELSCLHLHYSYISYQASSVH